MPESGEYDYLGFQRRLAGLEAARARAREILEVPEGADDEALRAAYRRKAKRFHPDRAQDTAEARRQFLLVRAAYELLAHGALSPLLASDGADANPQRPEGKYNLDSQWGHFLWWREKFFGQ